MNIDFFENPQEVPKSRADVRINQLGLYMYDDQRRFAVGFDITPFLEPPSIEVSVQDEAGNEVSSLHVIEANDKNFSLTMHLRGSASKTVAVKATLYYATPDTERMDVHTIERVLNITQPGEQ
jgi:hypothetical protein